MSDPRDERRSSDGDDPSPESAERDDRPREPPDEDGPDQPGHPDATDSSQDDDTDSPQDDVHPPGRTARESPSGTDPPASEGADGESNQDRRPVDRESPRTPEDSSPELSSGRNDRDRGAARDDQGAARDDQRAARDDRRTDRGPPPNRGESANSSPRSGFGPYLFDIVSSVLVVAAIGALLFATSGVWPPLVAIESGSMEPHIQEGDLVFVMAEERFPGDGSQAGSGVVSAQAGQETGYRMFENYGDVIVYQPYGSTEETPIIHRAMFWVEDGENWYDDADAEFVGNADSCRELANCPAPHAGFITKGDNTATNRRYDQAMGISGPVKPNWVMGTAEARVPILGEIRLLSGQATENRTASTVTIGN